MRLREHALRVADYGIALFGLLLYALPFILILSVPFVAVV